jgi:adenine/guanine phosphoribosyltransferase-like PRPP-binding protein
VKSLSELAFASLLAYSPRGQSQVSRESRKIRDRIKTADAAIFEKAAGRVVEQFSKADVDLFFGSEAILVPVPGSAPLRDPMGHWVARDICAALYKQGLGGDPMPLIVRTVAVPKSAFASPGERPDPQVHVDSLSVDREHVEKFGLLTPTKFTLVDDVITRGATLIGAATVLRAAFPGAEVRAFALLRTRGLVEDIEKILDPCVGRIWLDGDLLRREP